MNQASIFFRVFDLAFFAPGLVILLPVWASWRHAWAADKLDVVNGVMAAGAWVLLAYVLGLTVHSFGRILMGLTDRLLGEREVDDRRRGAYIILLTLAICFLVPLSSLLSPTSILILPGALAVVGLGRALGRLMHPFDAVKDKGRGALKSMTTHFDRPWAIEMRSADGTLCVSWAEEEAPGVSMDLGLGDTRYRLTIGNARDFENAVYNHHCPDGTVVHSRLDEMCWLGPTMGVASFGPYLSVGAGNGTGAIEELQVVACDAEFD